AAAPLPERHRQASEYAPAADEMQPSAHRVAVLLQVVRIELTETAEPRHGLLPGIPAGGYDLQLLRGANMITAIPNRHRPPPSRSQREGLTESTSHSHNSATHTYTPP